MPLLVVRYLGIFLIYFNSKNSSKMFLTSYTCMCNLPLATVIAYMTISKPVMRNILRREVPQVPVAPFTLFDIKCYIK